MSWDLFRKKKQNKRKKNKLEARRRNANAKRSELEMCKLSRVAITSDRVRSLPRDLPSQWQNGELKMRVIQQCVLGLQDRKQLSVVVRMY